MGAARIPHPGKELLDLKGLRRGPLRGDHFAADHVLVGADEAHLGPRRLLQNRLEQVRGGGLSVGAGDGHHGHIVRRMAEVVGAHLRQGPAGVRHLDIGDLRPLRHILAQHRRRDGSRRLADEGMAVHGKALHGNKQIAGFCCPGVIAHAADVQVRVRCGGQYGDAPQQVFQFHRSKPHFRVFHRISSLFYYTRTQTRRIMVEDAGNLAKPVLSPAASCLQTER